MGAHYTPSVVERVRHYSGERPLFDTANVDEKSRALSRRVDLKSGGYLIIDQTEALTTVDVNRADSSAAGISTTPSSRRTWRPRKPSRASCGCAIWAAS